MAVIQLVTGDRVVVEGVTAKEALSALYDAGRDRFASFEVATGTEYVNPAHVVRITES